MARSLKLVVWRILRWGGKRNAVALFASKHHFVCLSRSSIVLFSLAFSYPELRSSWPAPRIESSRSVATDRELSIRGAEDRSSGYENDNFGEDRFGACAVTVVPEILPLLSFRMFLKLGRRVKQRKR